MAKTRPPYSPEFRRQIVALVRAGRDPDDLAREFEPTAPSIRHWVAMADRRDGRREEKVEIVTPAERDAVRALTDWGLTDAVRRTHPDGAGPFSWWDYRAGAFHKGWGMRIDLALLSAPVAARLLGAEIDRDARKGPQPSDHAPVVIELSD